MKSELFFTFVSSAERNDESFTYSVLANTSIILSHREILKVEAIKTKNLLQLRQKVLILLAAIAFASLHSYFLILIQHSIAEHREQIVRFLLLVINEFTFRFTYWFLPHFPCVVGFHVHQNGR